MRASNVDFHPASTCTSILFAVISPRLPWSDLQGLYRMPKNSTLRICLVCAEIKINLRNERSAFTLGNTGVSLWGSLSCTEPCKLVSRTTRSGGLSDGEGTMCDRPCTPPTLVLPGRSCDCCTQEIRTPPIHHLERQHVSQTCMLLCKFTLRKIPVNQDHRHSPRLPGPIRLTGHTLTTFDTTCPFQFHSNSIQVKA